MLRSIIWLEILSVLATTVMAAQPGFVAGPSLSAARELAGSLLPVVVGAAGVSKSTDPITEAQQRSLGANLADYARNPGGDPAHFESLVEAARRILAGGTTDKRTPDATSAWLDETATAILAAVRETEAAAGPARDPALEQSLAELRARALLGRFHARRMLAAVHYNLFTRGLRLAELVAATYGEKEAVAVWRELVATAGEHPLAAQWRDELKKLEANVKDLEAQCCPPDEALLLEKIWTPTAKASTPPPAK